MPLSLEERTQVIGMWLVSGMNGKYASELLKEKGIKVYGPHVREIWREAGLEIGPHGGARYQDVKDYLHKYEYIIKAYRRYDKNPAVAARYLKPNRRPLIEKIWNLAIAYGVLKP